MAAMGEWTPGPWRAYCRHVNWRDGEPWPRDEFLQWEARLIAAAPELAEALSVIVDYLGSTAECGYDPFAAEPLIESARAALAKAGVK